MINKSKLLICIIAIVTILISTSSGFADDDRSIGDKYISERFETSDKESLENSVIEDIAYAAENFILISEADYNENKFSGILGMPQKHGADTELIDDSEINLNQEFNVLDAKDMKGKKLEDSSKFIKTEKMKLEPGQVIYTSKRNAKSIGEIDERAHVVLKNLKKYHINSGENSIENVSGNGLSRKCYLDIENENRVLLEDMDMVMVLESGRWKRFKMEDVMGIYDIESEFDCTLVRAPDQLDQIVSILFENLTRRPKYSNKAVGIVKNIEKNNDVIEVTIDSYGEQKNFRCLKEKIDVSDMKLDDLALICYKGDEINGYEIFDEDEIEEKTFFIRGEGDLELLGFASNDNFGIGDSVRVLDEKMFIDIREHFEKGQNIVVGKVLDDILLSKYEFIGGMDEKKVYKILEYDENSIIVGFRAEIDAEDEDFREEQKERLEFSESFKLPQIVDKYSVVNLMLDENNKLEFLHAKRDAEYCDVTAYSSVSPTGNKHYSQTSFRMGILKSHKLTDERFDGIIEYRDKMLRKMKMSQDRSDIKVYQLDVDTKGKPLELDVKSMQELKNLYDLKEINISDKDPHDNSDCPAFFEIENNELKSIVYINPIGDRLRGRFEEDDFVTNDNVKYEVDNLVVCDNNNRVMYYLLEVYKNEFGVDLVKIDGFRDYFVFIKDKTHISGERKNTIAIVNEIDSENHRASFINYETGYKSLYLDEMDEIIVKDIFENFKAGEIVKIDCREFGKTGIAVESIEHFYDPLREKAPIYRLKNIDGLNLTLERGKLKARDYDVYIENIVEEKYKAVEGVKVMKWGIDRDLSKNDYLYAHFDEAGNIDFIQVIGEYELYLHAE
jgi:hypothetical protein